VGAGLFPLPVLTTIRRTRISAQAPDCAAYQPEKEASKSILKSIGSSPGLVSMSF
jgi:hypothetical protein